MRNGLKWCLTFAALAVLASVSVSQAPDPTLTTIAVPDLHCNGCIKVVATKLNEVPGVAAVGGDMQTKTVTVRPKPQQVVSPRAIWEAVEKAGKHPTVLVGPSGKFTEKPKS